MGTIIFLFFFLFPSFSTFYLTLSLRFDTTTYNDFVAMNNAGIKLNALASWWMLQTPADHNSIADQVSVSFFFSLQ
jgi:hypothetical protein